MAPAKSPLLDALSDDDSDDGTVSGLEEEEEAKGDFGVFALLESMAVLMDPLELISRSGSPSKAAANSAPEKDGASFWDSWTAQEK